jgi:small subunit ribosomal protein S21
MHEVIVKNGEPIDRALKRLKGKMDADGVMDELRRLRSFETPGQKAKRKLKANHKREKLRRNRKF